MQPTTQIRRPWQRYVAEAIGTFGIVFAAGSAAITNAASNGAVSLLGQAFASGLMVAVMIYALGPVSAAHFNPAVTLAFATARRFPWKHVPAYLVAQIAGALLASFLHQLMFGRAIALQANFGANSSALTLPATIGYEIVLTFFLMFVIAAVATDKRVASPIPALAIGFTVVACITFGGTASGASMNPARSLAPAVFAGGASLEALPVYLIAPAIGAIFGALTNELLRDDHQHAQAAPSDFG